MRVGTEWDSSSPGDAAVVRPRLRGQIHLWSCWCSLAAAATLISLAAATVSGLAAVATSVYGVTVFGLFGVSALYHRRRWGPVAHRWMQRGDHAMIFLFIAGTYTPFTLLAMSPRTGLLVLSVVWLGALAGVGMKLFWPSGPRWAGPVHTSRHNTRSGRYLRATPRSQKAHPTGGDVCVSGMCAAGAAGRNSCG